jgi:hypothetical protein
MTQVDLPLKPDMVPVDATLVDRQPTFTSALLLCQQLSGLADKEVAAALKLDKAQWARIKSGDAHFPQDKLQTFMAVCGNEVPLLWLASQQGYELQPKLNEYQRQILLERERANKAEEQVRLMADLLTGRLHK